MNLHSASIEQYSAPVAPWASSGNRHTWPGLDEVISLVESSLSLRRSGAIIDRMQAGMAELIRRHAPRLPDAFLEADPNGYRRIELHYCPVLGYQILAMVWGPGQGMPIHDHGDTWGIESVWSGELLVGEFAQTESYAGLVRLVPRSAERITRGDVVPITPTEGIHLCRNPMRQQVAVSLHIYSAPLDNCREFDPIGDSWYQVRPLSLSSE